MHKARIKEPSPFFLKSHAEKKLILPQGQATVGIVKIYKLFDIRYQVSLNWTKKNCFAAARRNPTKVCNIYIKTATWRHSSINDWFVVQLVIKPWWKDWPSLMEFLIDILVDVDVGGDTLESRPLQMSFLHSFSSCSLGRINSSPGSSSSA